MLGNDVVSRWQVVKVHGKQKCDNVESHDLMQHVHLVVNCVVSCGLRTTRKCNKRGLGDATAVWAKTFKVFLVMCLVPTFVR